MNSENVDNTYISSDEASLKELILNLRALYRYLLSKWLIILVFGSIGVVLGCIYAYIKKPTYIATTTFVLEDEKGGSLGGLAGLASMAGMDLGSEGGGIFQGDNILKLYTSRRMLEKTLLTQVNVVGKDQLLVDRYIAFNNLKNLAWFQTEQLREITIDTLTAEVTRNRLRDSVLNVIVDDLSKNYLSVSKPDKKLSTIQVDVTAKDEVFAKLFNETLVKTVNQFYTATKTKKTTQNVKILQHKADSVRAVMNGAVYTAAAVIDATPNLNPTRQAQRVAPSQRAQLSAETNKVVLGELIKNLEMTKISLLKETPLIQVIDEPIFPLEVNHVSKLKGAILGAILFGFVATIALILRYGLNKILN